MIQLLTISVGTLLKTDAVVHRVKELEEVQWTCNSSWYCHPPYRWGECRW